MGILISKQFTNIFSSFLLFSQMLLFLRIILLLIQCKRVSHCIISRYGGSQLNKFILSTTKRIRLVRISIVVAKKGNLRLYLEFVYTSTLFLFQVQFAEGKVFNKCRINLKVSLTFNVLIYLLSTYSEKKCM